MLTQHASRVVVERRSTCRLGVKPSHISPVRSFMEPRQSIDPLSSKPRAAAAAPGDVYTVFSQAEVDTVLAEHSEKLVVIMCKSSHCKPCKTFMVKYHKLAKLMSDSVLLDVVGDTSPDTKKMMLAWAVKSTPTFRVYRGPEYLGAVTGAKEAKVLPFITELLRDGERGKSLQPEDLEESPSEDDDE